MTIEYSARFIKDLKALKGTPSFEKIKTLAFEFLSTIDSLDQIPHFSKLEVTTSIIEYVSGIIELE